MTNSAEKPKEGKGSRGPRKAGQRRTSGNSFNIATRSFPEIHAAWWAEFHRAASRLTYRGYAKYYHEDFLNSIALWFLSLPESQRDRIMDEGLPLWDRVRDQEGPAKIHVGGVSMAEGSSLERERRLPMAISKEKRHRGTNSQGKASGHGQGTKDNG